MKRSVEGESGRDAPILATAPSLEAAPQRSAGTPHGIGATPWGTKSATRRARFAHVCAGGAPATGVASGPNGRATKPTSQGLGVVRGTATDMGEQRPSKGTRPIWAAREAPGCPLVQRLP